MRLSAIGLMLTLISGICVAILAAEAQPPAKVPHIGVLLLGASSDNVLGCYRECSGKRAPRWTHTRP